LTTLGFPEAERHGRALPLKMGLAVIRTLRSRYGTPDLAIKWPNDILARPTSQNRDLSAFEGYGKLGGILCESSGHFFFAGIGLNLRTMAYEARTLPDAISLEEVLGPEAECPSPDFTSVVERRLLAQSIAESFLGLIDAESWMEEFHSALWGRGGLRSFELGAPGSGRVVDGRIRGIDEDGALVLELDSGERASFHSGELRSPR